MIDCVGTDKYLLESSLIQTKKSLQFDISNVSRDENNPVILSNKRAAEEEVDDIPMKKQRFAR